MLKNLREKRSIILLILLFTLSLSLIGCKSNEDKAELKDTDNEVEVENPDETKDEDETIVIKDMAGREVEIPKTIEKVYPTGTVAMISIYTINPEKLVGINSDPTEEEIKYLGEDYANKPVLGSYKGIDSGNEEEILNADPDIIISFGDIDDRWIEEADIGQEKLGIPYIMVDGDLENLPESYKFLGEILGEEEQANKLAEYCQNTLDEIEEKSKNIKEEDKKEVYYASQKGALVTNISGTIHAQILDLIGAKNVVEVDLEKVGGSVEVSLEEVLNWNPEVIIAGKGFDDSESPYEEIINNEDWEEIDAVKNKEVYPIPDAPFSWFDTPPSVNRVIGLKWAANKIYPDIYDFDMDKEIKEFYDLFYHKKLDDAELEELLN